MAMFFKSIFLCVVSYTTYSKTYTKEPHILHSCNQEDVIERKHAKIYECETDALPEKKCHCQNRTGVLNAIALFIVSVIEVSIFYISGDTIYSLLETIRDNLNF